MNAPTAAADDLGQRLAAARAEQAEAEEAIGVAILDGADGRAVRKRFEDAGANVEDLRLAIVERDRRAATAEREDREQGEADARYRWIAWHAEHMRRLVAMLTLQRQLDTAETALIALGSPDGADVLGEHGTAWITDELEAERLPQLGCYSRQGSVIGGAEYREARRRYTEEIAHMDPAEHAKVLDAKLKALSKDVDTRAIELPWEAAK